VTARIDPASIVTPLRLIACQKNPSSAISISMK